jgi:hypothetical protein
MKQYLFLLMACCILLTACSSSKTISVESSVEDFDMNVTDIPEEVSITSGEILYDDAGLRITTDSLESDSEETFLILNFENTSDEDMTITCESAAINGFVIRSSFSLDLAAGDSVLTGINFENSDLNACEINTITDLDFTLTVYDAQSYTYLFETDRMQIHTNQYGIVEQSVNTDGTVIYDKDNIRIISKGFTEDATWGDVIVLLVMNQSDKNISVGIKDSLATANDTEYEINFNSQVPSGHNAISYLYFQNDDGDGVQDITTASAVFTITDTDSWSLIGSTQEIVFSR